MLLSRTWQLPANLRKDGKPVPCHAFHFQPRALPHSRCLRSVEEEKGVYLIVRSLREIFFTIVIVGQVPHSRLLVSPDVRSSFAKSLSPVLQFHLHSPSLCWGMGDVLCSLAHVCPDFRVLLCPYPVPNPTSSFNFVLFKKNHLFTFPFPVPIPVPFLLPFASGKVTPPQSIPLPRGLKSLHD